MDKPVIEKGGIKKIKDIIKNNEFVINYQADFTQPLIRVATQAGHREIVDFLLKSGACTEDKDLLGGQAVHDAARFRRFPILKLLIETKPEIIFAKDKEGHTPLYYAIRNSDLKMVKFFLKQPGIDTNLFFDEVAAGSNKEFLHAFLKENPSLINKLIPSRALTIAIKKDNPEMVEFILDQPNINLTAISPSGKSYLYNAFIWSVQSGRDEIVKRLLTDYIETHHYLNDLNTAGLNDDHVKALIDLLKYIAEREAGPQYTNPIVNCAHRFIPRFFMPPSKQTKLQIADAAKNKYLDHQDSEQLNSFTDAEVNDKKLGSIIQRLRK